MAGACAQLDQTYNRPGELLLVGLEEPTAGCWVLDGHSQRLPSGSRIRSTVTSIDYDQQWDVFASVGYDGRVAFWSAESALLMKAHHLTSSPINHIVMGPKTIAACGSQDG